MARAQEQGTSPPELGRYLRGSGLEVVLDPVMNWYGGAPRAGSRFARFGADEALRMGEALQAVSITAIGQAGAPTVEEVAGRFGLLCDRAAGLGAQVHLEWAPHGHWTRSRRPRRYWNGPAASAPTSSSSARACRACCRPRPT